jgi:ubiquinone/menaquinone biosynthesis C-methylase UbiE
VKTARIEDVRAFWEAHPLCASAIPHPPGSAEFFRDYDALREVNESVAYSESLHEYSAFRGRDVLDVGAGNGYVLSRYAAAGARVRGIDITEKAVGLCRRRFELGRLRGEFLVASAESIPFPDQSFDCVCSMGVLHHTPDIERALAELRRVLRPGGRLIVMVYHRNSALYRLTFPAFSVIRGKSLAQLVDEIDGIGNPKGEVYSRRELKQLLTGFEEVRMWAGLLQPWMLPRVGSLVPRSALDALAGRFGWFLYAKAFKPGAIACAPAA